MSYSPGTVKTFTGLNSDAEGTSAEAAVKRVSDTHTTGAPRWRLNKSKLQNEFAQVLVFGDGLKALFHVGGVDYDLALFHIGRFKTDFI